MSFDYFCEIIETIRLKNPILFELSSSYHPTDNDFYIIQRKYNIFFPDDYMRFYKKYCGGYFGFITLFTYDEQDDLYILNHNSSELVKKSGFFAVCDMETGDYIGYKILNGKCSTELYYYDHELRSLYDSQYNDLLDFILREGFRYNKLIAT